MGKFNTLRHIEAVRNYLNSIVNELLLRGEQHDQSKLEEPEVAAFEKASLRLRNITFGSPEYKAGLAEIRPALEHHFSLNRHHPEHFNSFGVLGMNLVDLIEMICDWKASSLRHSDGDIIKSILINQERFKYSDDLAQIFLNTVALLEETETFHRADES